MLGIKVLSRLRGIGDAQSSLANKEVSSMPVPTPTVTSQVTELKKKNIIPEHLDASLVINADTKYDDWGYPIISPKDIKNGLEKARESVSVNKPSAVSVIEEDFNSSNVDAYVKTDMFGIVVE